MSKINDNVRKALEVYLLGDKEKALSMLIKGTKYHSYLQLIDVLKNDNALQVLKEDERLSNLLERFLEKESDEQRQILKT